MAFALRDRAREHHIGIDSRIQSPQLNFFCAVADLFLRAKKFERNSRHLACASRATRELRRAGADRTRPAGVVPGTCRRKPLRRARIAPAWRATGRSRGALAAERHRVAGDVLCLRATRRHRRVGQHALPQPRARRHPAALRLAPPLCGVFGFCSAMATLAAGRPLVMAPAWDAEQAARDLVAYRATHMNGTDDVAAQMIEIAGAHLSGLRFFGYAAFNPAQADVVQRADARGLKLVGLYGASEIQALFARQDENAPDAERMLGGGRPVSPAARVRARDPETGAVLPHGAAGELEFLAPGSRMT